MYYSTLFWKYQSIQLSKRKKRRVLEEKSGKIIYRWYNCYLNNRESKERMNEWMKEREGRGRKEREWEKERGKESGGGRGKVRWEGRKQGREGGRKERNNKIFVSCYKIGILKIQLLSCMKTITRTSLVAQWLRIHLPMQGTWVRSLVREDPTCRGETKPVRHNYWSPHTLEPTHLNYWAHVLQLLKPRA